MRPGLRDETTTPIHAGKSDQPSRANLNELIAPSDRPADAVALAAPGRRPLTYRQLAEQQKRIGAQLRQLGLGRQDRVAIVLPNGPEMATAFLAVAGAATAAPLNPAYRAHEFDFYLADLDARALIVGPGSSAAARTVAQARGIAIFELVAEPKDEAGRFALHGTAVGPANPDTHPAGGEDVALVLHTSGTTSRPKLVPLTHRNLCLSAHNVRTTLRLTPDDRCLNVMPLFHVHGLVAALLASLAAEAQVVCTPGFLAPSFLDWLEAERPTWWTAVPTMHQAILERITSTQGVSAQGSRPPTQGSRPGLLTAAPSGLGLSPEGAAVNRPGRESWAPLRLIRSASAALPPQVLLGLEAAFDVPVLEAYGMTEAAHQVCSNPLPPGQRKPGSVGPAAGPEVAILGPAGQLLPAGETGEVVLRGPNLLAGYAGNPEANAAAFHQGWFRTGDQGYLDSDGYLYLIGRSKEIINRGGEKIAPREVDEALLAHPGVAQAVTFAMPDARLGEEVAAAVVPAPGATLTEAELRGFVAQRLAEFKVPRRIVFVEEVPKGPTGKPQRLGLAGQLGLSSDRAEQPGSSKPPTPATETAREMLRIWSEVLRLEQIDLDSHFFRLGGDSILAAQVLARIQQRWQVELPFLVFFDSPTAAGLAAAVDTTRQGRPAEAQAGLDRLVSELEALSEEEAERLLAEEEQSEDGIP